MLAINIEDSAINLVAFRGRRAALAVSEPLAEGLVQNGAVLDREAVSEAIRSLLSVYGIKDRETCASVSGIHAIYRVVYVPKLEASLLAEAARREMERVTPVPLETLYTYWQAIKITNVESALCLQGIPRDNVDSVFATLKSAGLQVKYLELKPVSVARQADTGSAIIIDVGRGSFDITVIDRGIPELIRSLSFAAASMSDEEKTAQVREEVSRTVSFYNSTHGERPLSGKSDCLLSGYLADSLFQSLAYQARPLPLALTFQGGTDTVDFAVCSGLAARAARGSLRNMRLDINALPSVAPAAAPGTSKAPLALAVAGVVIIVGLYLAVQAAAGETAGLRKQVADKTSLVAQAQKQLVTETEKATKELEANKQAVTVLKAPLDYLANQRSAMNAEIGEAIARLPATMYFTLIESDGAALKLEGTAPTESMVSDYARDLRNSRRYGLVLITSMANKEFNEIEFKIKVTLNR